MYKILDAPERMSREQIKAAFKNKWVFFVDVEGPTYGWFDTAVPVVVADKPFDGWESGIYKRLHDEHGGNSTIWNLLSNDYNVFGISEVEQRA